MSGADKDVQGRQVVLMIKGHNPNFDTTKDKSPYESGDQIFFMPGSFWFKLSEMFNIAVYSVHTTRRSCIEALTF